MADVRSLLKSERAARRIDHPNASYSSTGKLSCSVCGISLPPDQETFNKHLKSTQHAMRAERLRLSQKPSSTARPETRQLAQGSPPPNKKKRKASDSDEDARKRNKPIAISHQALQHEEIKEPVAQENVLPPPSPDPVKTDAPSAPPIPKPEIDEAEWAAFERDVATPPPPDPFLNESIISAAPISAADLAEQEKLKAKEQGKERPDEEMEDEKEDAARALEEEFDEMEGLENRLKRLREKREELRRKAAEAQEKGGGVENNTSADMHGESSEDGDDLDEWGYMR